MKEKVIDRKCAICGQILPKKSRSDKKTCSATCRKKYSMIATIDIGGGQYKKADLPKHTKEYFQTTEEIKQSYENLQHNIILSGVYDKDEEYKNVFKSYAIYSIRHIRSCLDMLEDSLIKDISIDELTDILDDLDDRDNNLFSNNQP